MRRPTVIRFFAPLVCSAFFALALVTSDARATEAPELFADQPAVGLPDWMRQAIVYEINVRQFSAGGNFAGVTASLPRLKKLGVDVLWLMPIHPIGTINRKGPLGSYYAVQDYFGINPEFGTEADFRELVTAAHREGFHVILDWVGNHTAWDNALTSQHPEYYRRDRDGRFQPPTGFDWTDVIQLDFSNPGVLDYETAALTHWVKDFGIDGFRCDFATGVPTAFWSDLFGRLRKIRRDLFFLAESELPQHQLRAFNASYGFNMMQTINSVAQGRSSASAIDEALAQSGTRFPHGAALLYYTSNHDENSWQGTEFERLGGGSAPFAVLSFLLDGIPLIYDGQEVGLNRRLDFFQRDPIAWPPDHPLTVFYQRLCELRKNQPALRTGSSMRRLSTTRNDSIYAVLREGPSSRVVAFLNLTAKDVSFDVFDPALASQWRDAFTNKIERLNASAQINLKSWGYTVLVSSP